MSMPGFVFFFRCPRCGKASEVYSLYPFPDLFRCCLSLPAWSRELRCYMSVGCELSREQRERVDGNRAALRALAQQLSSSVFTVGVPWLAGSSKAPGVEVDPLPECPSCGALVEPVFGYPGQKAG